MLMHDVFLGDCLEQLKKLAPESIDLVYLDPPFFTQKVHKLSDRSGQKTYSFKDQWETHNEYAAFLRERLIELKRVMKATASIFFHCDDSASHIVRFLLDEIFGKDNYRSKIIWTYKRWSNAKKGLLPAYQEIFFYSKTREFKFNKIYNDYSPTTNLDQILQKRERDDRGKAVYARNQNGDLILSSAKTGVPLTDVWEIPYLNPKANERVGYPTQKPILLLEKIISLVTAEGDSVLDPFCGSGTTLIASKLLKRSSIGIDISEEAVSLTRNRLDKPIKTSSNLLLKGKESYINASNPIYKYLSDDLVSPVQRNKGIDAILKSCINNKPVLVRVQKDGESVAQAACLLAQAALEKGETIQVLIVTHQDLLSASASENAQKKYPNMLFIESVEITIKNLVANSEIHEIQSCSFI